MLKQQLCMTEQNKRRVMNVGYIDDKTLYILSGILTLNTESTIMIKPCINNMLIRNIIH